LLKHNQTAVADHSDFPRGALFCFEKLNVAEANKLALSMSPLFVAGSLDPLGEQSVIGIQDSIVGLRIKNIARSLSRSCCVLTSSAPES
jgi:hypothetical protein